MTIFSFCKQKKIGQEGEDDFERYYSHLNIQRESGKTWDFSLDGNGIEVKADNWKLKNTPNVFLEMVSNREKDTPGALPRAVKDKVRYFVYYFVHDKTFFWYDVKRLYRYVKRNLHKFEKKVIHNRKHETIGYLVPREKIAKYCEREDFFG